VRFDQPAINAQVGASSIASAKLRLYVSLNANNWGSTGRTVGVHRMTQDWTENGVTWNCPNDTLPTNSSPNCNPAWDMANFPTWPFEKAPTSTVLHTNGMTGWIEWDVTSDVVQFVSGTVPNYGWIVRKMQENDAGHVDYSSREELNHPPQLVITLG